uniref:Thrombospondin-like N-terminal domain-containing protein n=1 Tax=Paramormyrops kingsleyae TaxID=1676925 RepID=A0A3B3R8V1_9TELE
MLFFGIAFIYSGGINYNGGFRALNHEGVKWRKSDLFFSVSAGVDLLYPLGLTGSKERDPLEVTPHPSSTPSPSPQGLLLSGAGVVLRSSAHIDGPITGLFPTGIGDDFSFVVCLSAWRVNNAFVVSITNGKNRLQFGIQLVPKKVVVYITEKTSVFFKYDVLNGPWHSFAIGVRPRSVSFYAECGGVRYSEQTIARPQELGPDSQLTIGRMNLKAVQFEGVICQLDMYPTAQAAAHYCDYIKKQCRLADTYRSPPPSLENVSQYGTASTSESYPTKSRPTESSTSVNPNLRSVNEKAMLLNTVADRSSRTNVGVRATLDNAVRSTASLVEANDAEVHSFDKSKNAKEVSTTVSPTTPESWIKERLMLANTSQHQRLADNLTQVLLKTNSTLYRNPVENQIQVENSEERSYEAEYDAYTGNYDYGYEEADFSFDYDGLWGPKGEPGPPVSDLLSSSRIFLFLCLTEIMHFEIMLNKTWIEIVLPNGQRTVIILCWQIPSTLKHCCETSLDLVHAGDSGFPSIRPLSSVTHVQTAVWETFCLCSIQEEKSRGDTAVPHQMGQLRSGCP